MRFRKSSFLLSTFLLVFLGLGQCKTLPKGPEKEGRGMENFVNFEGEGDQLAVESTSTEDAEVFEGKREILGAKNIVVSSKRDQSSTEVANTSRQCANATKVLYPIIPVIIASLVGLIGAIIISAIARGIFKLINMNHDMEDSGYGYEKRKYRSSSPSLFGFDMSKIDYLGMTKRILRAIEKVY